MMDAEPDYECENCIGMIEHGCYCMSVGAVGPGGPLRSDLTPNTRRTTMNFSEALSAVKNGHKIARAGWNGKDMFLFLVHGSVFKVNRPPLLGIYPEGTEITYHAHIDMKTAQGYVVPWLASQADLLSDDWEVVR